MLLMIDNQHLRLSKSNAIQSNQKKLLNSIINSPRKVNVVCCRPRKKAGIVAGIKTTISAPMALNDAKIRSSKRAEKSFKLTDTHGLYLEVRPTGAKLWRYRYRIAGKENVYAIGEHGQAPAGETKGEASNRRASGRYTLAEARKERDHCKGLIQQGIHPAHNRKLAKAARAVENANTFEAVAREWIERKKPGWTPHYFRQVERFLESDTFPHIGALPIRSVTAEPSFNKALHVAHRHAQEETYADGSKRSFSERKIREHWVAFKSVAHFWAGLRLDAAYPFTATGSVFLSDEFPIFLEVVAEMLNFGCSCRCVRAKPRTPILDRIECWTLPARVLTRKVVSERLPERLLRYLKDYVAPAAGNSFFMDD